MKLQKRAKGILQDLVNLIAMIEMELHLLEIKQVEVDHALGACKKARKMSKMLGSLLGEDNESSSGQSN